MLFELIKIYYCTQDFLATKVGKNKQNGGFAVVHKFISLMSTVAVKKAQHFFPIIIYCQYAISIVLTLCINICLLFFNGRTAT